MAAYPFVDRADVQARRAPDAAQRRPSEGVGQHVRPAVVDQDDVHVLGSVAGCDAGPHRGVGVHPLARGGAGQEPHEHFQVRDGGECLLDADH